MNDSKPAIWSPLDESVARVFHGVVENSKRATGLSSPAIYSDQLSQDASLAILENDMRRDVNHKPRLDALEKVRSIIDRAEEHRQFPEIKRESLIDPMTGLQNRRYAEILMKNTADHLGRGDYGEGGVVLLMFDLNSFKLVNDTIGHPAGDEVIKMAAYELRSRVRPYDVCARWGGEEYLITLASESLTEEVVKDHWGLDYLPDHQNPSYGSVMEDIQKNLVAKLQEFNPEFFNSNPDYVPGSLSYGWCYLSKKIVDERYGGSAEDAIKAAIRDADDSLYHNKKRIKRER